MMMSTAAMPMLLGTIGIGLGAIAVAGTIRLGLHFIGRRYANRPIYGYQPQYNPYNEPYYNGY